MPTLPLVTEIGQDLCPLMRVEVVDLAAPDYDPEEDGPPAFPMALTRCTHTAPCLYQLVYAGNPWSPFDVWMACGAWTLVWGDETMSSWRLLTAANWPQHPPSAPRSLPSGAEQLQFVWQSLIGPEQEREAAQRARRGGYLAGVTYLIGLLKNRATSWLPLFPHAKFGAEKARVWFCQNEYRYSSQPDVEEDLTAFVRRFFLDETPQQATMELL